LSVERSTLRVAVFRALFLGDLIVALPALQMLRANLPEAEITLIGLPWAEEIVKRTDSLDRLLPFPGFPGIAEVPYDQARTEAFLAATRAEPFDLAIQMHGDGTTSNGFVAALGARTTLGYARKGDNRLTIALPYVDEMHEIERWMRLIECLPLSVERSAFCDPPNTQHNNAPTHQRINAQRPHAQRSTPTRPTLNATPAETARAASLLAGLPDDGPLVALHPGAKDEARRWPPPQFAALADALHERFGARLVLTGSAAEQPITSAVAAAAQAPVRNLAGLTKLGELIALVARLDLLVSNDTGAAHVATTTRTPSVALFGPSRPAQWAHPDRERHRVVDALVLAPPGTDPAEALRKLPVQVVREACEQQLEARRLK
jgi:ADP-heptose:LPS heptosyltransferase